MNKKVLIKNNRGYALVLVILVVLLIVTFSASMVVLSGLDQKLSSKQQFNTIARQAAEAGIEHALYELSNDSSWNAGFDDVKLEPTGSAYFTTFNSSSTVPYSTNNTGGTGEVKGYQERVVPQGAIHIVSIGKYRKSQVAEEILATTGQTTLFKDDFTAGKDRWNETVGRYFYLRDNKYYLGRDHGNSGEHRTFAGDDDWTDFTITVKANLLRGKGYGIYFRTTNEPNINSYIFQYDPFYNRGGQGSFLFRKVKNGRETAPIASTRRKDTVFKGPDTWWYKQEREIKLEVKGNNFKAYVDGVLVVEATDNSFDEGKIGFRTWGKSQAYFDSVEIEGGEGGINVISRW